MIVYSSEHKQTVKFNLDTLLNYKKKTLHFNGNKYRRHTKSYKLLNLIHILLLLLYTNNRKKWKQALKYVFFVCESSFSIHSDSIFFITTNKTKEVSPHRCTIRILCTSGGTWEIDGELLPIGKSFHDNNTTVRNKSRLVWPTSHHARLRG